MTKTLRFHREYVPIDNLNMVSRAAISRDIWRLLSAFSALVKIESNYSFSTFRECWKRQKFIGVHFVSLNADARPLFMEELFAQFLKFLLIHKNVEIRLGSFYALAAIYLTQPTNTKIPPKNRIKVMPEYSHLLFQFLDICKERQDFKDARYLAQRLIRDNAFVLVPYHEPLDEQIHFMKNFDIETGNFPLAPDTKYLHSRLVLGNLNAMEAEIVTDWCHNDFDQIVADFSQLVVSPLLDISHTDETGILFESSRNPYTQYEQLKAESGLFDNLHSTAAIETADILESLAKMKDNFEKTFGSQDQTLGLLSVPLIDNSRRKAHINLNSPSSTIAAGSTLLTRGNMPEFPFIFNQQDNSVNALASNDFLNQSLNDLDELLNDELFEGFMETDDQGSSSSSEEEQEQ